MKKIITVVAFALVSAIFAVNIFAAKKEKKAKVQKIYVGVGNSYKPYCYIDEKGQPAGYELEVLKAIDELLPQYEFTYEPTKFATLFSSLSQGKYDVIAQQIEYNPERAARYEFTKETYTTFAIYVSVLQSRNDISSIDDLSGKVAYVTTAGNARWALEDYNKKHPGKEIKLSIADLSNDEIVAGLKNGRYDAVIWTKRDVAARNKEYNAGLKTVGAPVQSSNTYYLFQKGNTTLRDAFDGAIRELKSSGKLKQISIDVLGADYTESE